MSLLCRHISVSAMKVDDQKCSIIVELTGLSVYTLDPMQGKLKLYGVVRISSV